MMFSGTLNLPPMAQPRPRLTTRGGKPRAYEPARATAWKEAAAILIRRAMKRQGVLPFVGAVSVNLAFSIRSKKLDHETREDVDNLAKSWLDAATRAGLWHDDRQVTHLVVWKHAVAGDGCISFIVQTDALARIAKASES